jgi:aminopeptidase N
MIIFFAWHSLGGNNIMRLLSYSQIMMFFNILHRDHFWLNEGWTVWLERKIMSRIKKNPKYLDFDSIQGRKALSDTVAQIAPQNTRLVLDIGDGDPDDFYSKVAYEKVRILSQPRE